MNNKEVIERFDKKFPIADGMCQSCELAGCLCEYCEAEWLEIKDFIQQELEERDKEWKDKLMEIKSYINEKESHKRFAKMKGLDRMFINKK